MAATSSLPRRVPVLPPTTPKLAPYKVSFNAAAMLVIASPQVMGKSPYMASGSNWKASRMASWFRGWMVAAKYETVWGCGLLESLFSPSVLVSCSTCASAVFTS